MVCLVYEKREGLGEQRDPERIAFLEGLGDVRSGLRWLHQPTRLAKAVKDDVARWQAE